MAALTTQYTNEAGAELTMASASGGGDTATWDPDGFLIINNGSGGSLTVTVSEQLSSNTVQSDAYGDLTKADASIAVGGGEIGVLGPFKRGAFRNSSGNIAISYSGVTSLTVAWVVMQK